jgi:hypothetical protein
MYRLPGAKQGNEVSYRAIFSGVQADAGIIPFHPAVALRDLPDLLLLRDLDPVAGQRNQPLHHYFPVVRWRPVTGENGKDIKNKKRLLTRWASVAASLPEDDDVAAGEFVAVEAELLHQRAFSQLGVEGGVHRLAVHSDV